LFAFRPQPRGHASHPVGHAGVGPLGGILGSGGGGLLGTAGTAMGAAALGTALLNPVSCLWGKHSFHDKLIM